MAIHPSLRSEQPSHGGLSPHQTRAISAWSEQAALSLENLTLSESRPVDDPASQTTPTRSALRGATVSLSIPLDDPVPHAEDHPAPRAKLPTVSFRRREPLRRDNMRRREALLKGKDGSRRRQRWENGMFQ